MCALRFGRNPCEQSRKSCSNTAHSTQATAFCTTRSSIVVMPSGRSFPFAFGMYDASDRWRSIASALQPSIQVPEVLIQLRRVVFVALSIYAWRRLLAQGTERQAQQLLVHELNDVGESVLLSCSRS